MIRKKIVMILLGLLYLLVYGVSLLGATWIVVIMLRWMGVL